MPEKKPDPLTEMTTSASTGTTSAPVVKADPIEKIVMDALRPWSIGKGAGLSRDYHFVPGNPVDVASQDLALLRRLAGPGRSFGRHD